MAKERESYVIPVQNNFSVTASENYYRNQKSKGAKYLIYAKNFLLLLYHYQFRVEDRTQVYHRYYLYQCFYILTFLSIYYFTLCGSRVRNTALSFHYHNLDNFLSSQKDPLRKRTGLLLPQKRESLPEEITQNSSSLKDILNTDLNHGA